MALRLERLRLAVQAKRLADQLQHTTTVLQQRDEQLTRCLEAIRERDEMLTVLTRLNDELLGIEQHERQWVQAVSAEQE